MTKLDIQAEVRAANLSLKADLHRVAIQVRGKKLSLVATLPPKPNSTKHKPHQQRISHKRWNANKLGLKRAKAKALILSDHLDRDKFNWDDWINLPGDEPELETCGYWLKKFKAHVWPNLPGDKEFHWRKRYLYFGFNKLPIDKPLTSEAIILAALTKPEDKKAARDKTCEKLQRFADFAGITVDLNHYKTGYSTSDIKPRDIPTDIKIENLIDNIRNPHWRYVFALMATYGLRDHEAFLCTLESRDSVLIANVPEHTKTREHIAYPYRKEWVDRWQLATGMPPQFTVRANEDYGQKTAEQWRDRLKYPGTPYGLRHAYAIRCHQAGIAIAIASQWMGHSPETHLRRYQRWISETVSREAWDKL